MLKNNLKMNKRWIYTPTKSQYLVEQILINRNISKDQWPNFLEPDFSKGLYDPYLLDTMVESVERIKLAIKNKEIIGIFADYDADGIPACVLLSEALEKHGLKTYVYIPSRQEGYGLNKKGIDQFKEQGVTLLFTVDLGIREIANTEYAKSLGMDVIITDHHEPGETIPDALAVINPKRKNSKYPFRELSGGGVVFKLIQALSQELKKISQADLKWMLDLVGITTICDVVPLIDENRIFAKYGLVVLAKTKRIGLIKLYQLASIDPSSINTYTVGFQIGPRINAPGRLNKNQQSFELLKTHDEKIASELALELDEINKQRQLDLDRMLSEARAMVYENKMNEKKVICLSSKNWPSGLIGLIAGKLTEEFSRPCLILEEGESESKGSARSIDHYNIIEVLDETKSLLKNYGGHTKAAGLTILNSNLSLLYDRMLAIAQEKLTAADLMPKVVIDAKLSIDNLTFGFLNQIKKLEPFGLGNPRPVFCLENVEPENIRLIGQSSQHLKFRIGGIDVIGFNFGDWAEKIHDKKINFVFNLDENIWNGVHKIQLKIIDLKISE